jgi:hypothetical protein
VRPFAVAAGVAIALVFVLQATAGATAAAGGQIAPAAGFTFPYAYGTPVVPKGVGAQGVQGPNVPASQIGPRGTPGYSGHIGPVNLTNPGSFQVVTSSVEVIAYNGTPGPHVGASHQAVSFQNLTFGSWVSGITSNYGYVNLSLPEGWYAMYVNSSTAASFASYEAQINITHTATTLTRYLIPAADTKLTLNNGGATKDNIWLTVQPIWSSVGIPQMNVTVLNESNSGASLGTIYTGSNGTAEVASANQAYSYELVGGGQKNALTGIYYNLTQTNTGSFSPSSANYHTSLNIGAMTFSAGATVTGTALPSGQSAGLEWSISANTKVTGGNVLLGSGPGASAATLRFTFVNTVVYMDNPGAYTAACFSFVNTTVVFISEHYEPMITSAQTSVFFNNSVWMGGAISTTGEPMYFDATKATSSIFENFRVPSSHGFLGTYANSEFLNATNYYSSGQPLNIGSTNFQNVSIVNSIAYQYTNNVWLNWTGVKLVNSSVALILTSANVQNSSLNMTIWPYTSGDVDSVGFVPVSSSDTQRSIFRNDWFSEWVGPGFAFSTVYRSWTGLINANLAVVQFQVPEVTNISFSVVNMSQYPSLNSTWGAAGNVYGTSSYYDDIIEANYSERQMTTLVGQGAYPEYDDFVLGDPHPRNVWMNYTDLALSGMTYVGTGNGNWSLNHDLFPYWDFVESRAIFQLFEATPLIPHISFSVTNTTFAAARLNYTLEHAFNLYTHGTANSGDLWDVPIQVMQDTGGPPRPNDLITFVSDTLRWQEIGPYNSGSTYGGGYGTLGFGEGGVNGSVSNCIFYNQLPSTVTYSKVAPLASDIYWMGGNTSVTGNWFLSLDNQTVPLESASNANPYWQGWAGHLVLGQNHYFYSPLVGTTYVPVGGTYGPTSTAMTSGATKDPTYHVVLSNATATYEIPMGPNDTITAATNAYQLVSNTSIRQGIQNGLWLSGTGTTILNSKDWSWSVAPDVNVSSGSPVLSYSNGLVAGPQPNFYWHGYNYSEQVEPSYIQLGVNSSRAPPVIAQFAGLTPGSDYTVTEYDQGNAIAAVNYYANAQGIVNQTFDPATMPLDPIFAIAPAGSGGPGPCTVNCGGVSPTPSTPGFSLTFNLSIWTIVGAVVAFVGLIVASSGGKRFIPGTGIAVLGILVFVVGTL